MVSFLSEFYAPSDSAPAPEPVLLLAPWPFPTYERPNPLAAMCHYRNAHSTERLPEPKASSAKPAIGGLMCVRELGDRSRIGA